MLTIIMEFWIGKQLDAPAWYWWLWGISAFITFIRFGFDMFKAGAKL